MHKDSHALSLAMGRTRRRSPSTADPLGAAHWALVLQLLGHGGWVCVAGHQEATSHASVGTEDTGSIDVAVVTGQRPTGFQHTGRSF